MPSLGTDKRKTHNEKPGRAKNKAELSKEANVSRNILMDNYHNYAAKEDVKLSVMDEDEFSEVPITSSKSPPSKKGKHDTTSSGIETDSVDALEFVSALAQLINIWSDN